VPSERNSWAYKDLPSPLISPEEAKEILETSTPKSYHDPTTTVGDIILDYKRSVRISVSSYRCPFCDRTFTSWQDAVQHVQEVQNRYKTGSEEGDSDELLEHPPMTVQDLTEDIAEETLSNAYIFYEVVRPEEVLPFPSSPEWNGKNSDIKSPSPKQREEHDQLVAKWREMMQATKGKRKLNLTVLPHGKTFLKSPSDSWYYYCPQIYENGKWVPLPVQALPTLDEKKEKVRVLVLRGIISAEELNKEWEE